MKGVDRHRWRRISGLLDELLALPPEPRKRRLAELASGDGALAEEVTRLLAAEGAAAELFSRPAGEQLAELIAERDDDEESHDPLLGSMLGPWRLLRRTGRGGMGVVYLAEREGEGFVQRAAVKLLRLDLDDPTHVARFRRERRILARLEHPGIARLIDGGVAAGRPYVAIEYVEGEPITEACDRRRLSVEERLRLAMEMCDAVAYAHRNLVVHRDLKPSNILLTAEGHVKLLDFGIGRLLDESDDEAATRQGELLFTPAYAAPEQLLGEPPRVATDVYGIGLVLYELLCGRRAQQASGSSPRQLADAIVIAEPAPPSRAAATAADAPDALSADAVAAARATTPQRLRRRLQGDLDTIARSCLRKEPEQRYRSVEALRDDLERHLTGHPLTARPLGRLYRARKFMTRHRAAVTAAAAVLAALLLGLATTAWQARERQRQALRAEQEARTAEEITAFLVGLFDAADPAQAQGAEITASQLLTRGAARIEATLGRAPEVKARLLLTLSEIAERLGEYERSLELADGALALRRDLGADAAGLADALQRKGSALAQLGRLPEAEAVLREALALHERQLGRVSLPAAVDLEHLAFAAFQAEEPAAAEPLLREALDTRRRLQGERHAEVARALGQLAVLRRQQGDLRGAEALYHDALPILDGELGEDHPETVVARNNLAALLVHQGELAAAAELFRQVAAAHERVHGAGHPLTVTARNNLAVALLKQGRAAEAQRLFAEIVAYWEESAGRNHPNALATRLNLAAALRAAGEPAAAEALYREALAGVETLFGRDHPHAAAAVGHLAAMALERGDLAQAQRLAEDALARRRASRGAEHPEVALSLHQLADVARQGGDGRRAGELYRQAWELRRRALGDDHPDTRASREALAALPEGS